MITKITPENLEKIGFIFDRKDVFEDEYECNEYDVYVFKKSKYIQLRIDLCVQNNSLNTELSIERIGTNLDDEFLLINAECIEDIELVLTALKFRAI